MATNILILVPFGNMNPVEDRTAQLDRFIKHFKQLCPQFPNNYFILVSEQELPKKYFNRGQICNIGIRYFKSNVGTPSVLIIHDVDILPNQNMFKKYNLVSKSYCLMPIQSDTYNTTYSYKLTTGSAVFLTTIDTYTRCNGYPNNYWGWGGEDNALDIRYRANKIKLKYNNDPVDDFESIDTQRTTNAAKMAFLRKNKIRNMMTRELLAGEKKTWRRNGYAQLDDLNYHIIYEDIEEHGNLKIVRIKSELDTLGLEKNIKFNEKVYAQLAERPSNN